MITWEQISQIANMVLKFTKLINDYLFVEINTIAGDYSIIAIGGGALFLFMLGKWVLG
jgi:hypothetical protein